MKNFTQKEARTVNTRGGLVYRIVCEFALDPRGEWPDLEELEKALDFYGAKIVQEVKDGKWTKENSNA